MIKIGKGKFWFGGALFQFYFLLGGTAPPAPPPLSQARNSKYVIRDQPGQEVRDFLTCFNLRMLAITFNKIKLINCEMFELNELYKR